jgi:hypothetical protein
LWCDEFDVINRSDPRRYEEELMEAAPSEVRSVGCLVAMVFATPMFLTVLTWLVFF